MAQTLTIYTDGGSRGNPGPSAIGVYFPQRDKSYGEYIGKGTNNVAEYKAMIFALKKAKQLVGSKKARETTVEIKSDSKLIVNQLNGFFKLKEPELFEYFIHLWNLQQDFENVIFTYIPREENKRADALVNETLDDHAQKGLF